jgi:hypothetical protein
MSEEEVFHFDQLTIEDAGMGHGYAMPEGFHYYDSVKECQEEVDKWIIMEKMYEEIMREKEYIPVLQVVYNKAIMK